MINSDEEAPIGDKNDANRNNATVYTSESEDPGDPQEEENKRADEINNQ